MVPRENKNNASAKFGGTNKEYYGIFRSGLLYVYSPIKSLIKTYYNPYFLSCTLNIPRSAANTSYITTSLAGRKSKKLSSNLEIALQTYPETNFLSSSSVEGDFVCPKSALMGEDVD